MKRRRDVVTLEEFKNIKLIVAQIKEVKEHPDADRLYLLTVDTGSGEKQLVAGIRPSYTKAELAGRRVIIIDNLEPAVIRGEKSQGMLLAVGDDKRVSLLSPDHDVDLGSVVR